MMSELKNKIAKRLGEINKNQKWLVKRIEYLYPDDPIRQENLSRLISGRVPNPTVETCIKVAKALGSFIEELWYLE